MAEKNVSRRAFVTMAGAASAVPAAAAGRKAVVAPAAVSEPAPVAEPEPVEEPVAEVAAPEEEPAEREDASVDEAEIEQSPEPIGEEESVANESIEEVVEAPQPVAEEPIDFFEEFHGELVRSLTLERQSNGEVEVVLGESAELILADLATQVGHPLRPTDLRSYATKLRLDKNVTPRFQVTKTAGGVHLRILIHHIE